jgi:glycerol-3-phosphate O-acyltransferase / dihydroxyacetone phosphate acyltransferase
VVRLALDRLLLVVARVLALGFFRRIEVDGRSRLPGRGQPTLFAVSHLNGFVDPVVFIAGVRRFPRFIAKRALWRYLPARPVLALVGVVPVERREDSADTSSNRSSFEACHRVLSEGQAVAIFPEGTTHDRLELAPIRTGAARIALGARAAGVGRITIVPVGILYESKFKLRSRALLRVGEPIDLDDAVASLVPGRPVGGEDDHEAVRALTDQVATNLTAASPRFASVFEWQKLAYASEVALRQPDRPVRLVDREDLAQAIADAPSERVDEVAEAIAIHHLNLSAIRITDEQLLARELPGRVLKRAIVTGVLLAIAALFLLVGVLVNLAPAVLTMAVSAAVRAPVTKGTVRTLAAAVLFPLAWWGTAAWLSDGFWAVLLEGLVFATCGLLLFWAWDAVTALWNDVQALRHRHDARAVLDQLHSSRDAVVRAVDLAVPHVPVP